MYNCRRISPNLHIKHIQQKSICDITAYRIDLRDVHNDKDKKKTQVEAAVVSTRSISAKMLPDLTCRQLLPSFNLD